MNDSLNDFLSLIKLEIKARMPFPVLEFFFLLFFLYGLTTLIGFYQGGSADLDIFRISAQNFIPIVWERFISSNILILAIVLAILVTMSIASEYENGTMMNLLTLPVTRIQYLGAKCFIYGAVSIGAVSSAFIVSSFLSPFLLSPLGFIEVLLIWISVVLLFTSIPLFIAINTRKASITLLTSVVIDLIILIVLAGLPDPYHYFFHSAAILTAENQVEAWFWGIILPSLAGFILLLLSFYRFIRMDILGGED